MRILVSNDDGIHAPGIKALAERLAREHEVTIIAPDRERSATGHALTLHKPLRAEETPGFRGIRGAWAVNGTPSDCVKLAFGAILEDPPNLVISGINRGPNLGSDVLYSGTVSAAVEGSLMGTWAIAISLTSFADVHYEVAADFAAELVQQVAKNSQPPRTLLNVNVPALAAEEIAGVRITRLGIRRYSDIFEPRVDLRGKTYYWLSGEVVETEEHEDTDVVAIKDCCISITPIHYDLTYLPQIEALKSWNFNTFPPNGRTKASG